MSIVPSDPHPTMPAEPATPDDQPVPDDASISSSTRPARRTYPAWVLPTATGVLGIAVGAAVLGAITTARDSATRSAVLSEAIEACDLTTATGIDLADEGRSITFDMKGEEDTSGAGFPDITCLFAKLDMPSAVLSHIGQTTSMDGRQTEAWKTFTVSWSFHPDRGFDGVLTVTDD